MNQKITREEVARAAGVTASTVSLAMRGLAGVAPATRERVLAAAQRLGYAPSVAAAHLASRRHGGGRERYPVVYLSEDVNSKEGIDEKFPQVGLEAVWRRPSAFASPQAASRQLWQEGFTGVVFHPFKCLWSLEERARFDWGKFSVVKDTRGFADLAFHLVRHSPFDYMEEVLGRTLRAGYQRVAVLLMESDSARDDDARFGAMLNWRERKLPEGAELRWRFIPGNSPSVLDAGTLEWLRAEPTDAVILYHWVMIYPLLQAGWKVPGDLAAVAVLATHLRYDGIPLVSGCDVAHGELKLRIARLLRDLILRGERGFPEQPMELVVEPRWIEGETLPKLQ